MIGRNTYCGESYPVHTHNFYEAIVYYGGVGAIQTEVGTFPVEDGTIAVIPPQVKHGTLSSAGLNCIYLNNMFDHLLDFTEPQLFSDIDGDGVMLAKTIYENRFSAPEYRDALCNAFGQYLLKNLKVRDALTIALEDVVKVITDRFYDTALDLTELLNQTGYAEDYIRAQFKRVMGKTPNNFLTEIRIHNAAYLIDIYKNVPLTEIAKRCGYGDYAYFSKRFKQVMHCSPQQYKKQEE